MPTASFASSLTSSLSFSLFSSSFVYLNFFPAFPFPIGVLDFHFLSTGLGTLAQVQIHAVCIVLFTDSRPVDP